MSGVQQGGGEANDHPCDAHIYESCMPLDVSRQQNGCNQEGET